MKNPYGTEYRDTAPFSNGHRYRLAENQAVTGNHGDQKTDGQFSLDKGAVQRAINVNKAAEKTPGFGEFNKSVGRNQGKVQSARQKAAADAGIDY